MTSFGSLGAKEEWEEGKNGANGRVEDVMELQIAEENICRSAHYGYVVRQRFALVVQGLIRFCSIAFLSVGQTSRMF